MANKQILPRYPVYIPSKGRYDMCLTARFLKEDGVPFKLVVEPQEANAYAERHGEENVLVLPFSDRGSVVPARNWIKRHSTKRGDKRHWQLDDNIRSMYRWYKNKRIKMRSGVGMRAMEDFVDRYENIAFAGPNYDFFAIARKIPPFYLNVHVYSFVLTLNSIPYAWRGKYNEDTDICLQALSGGWCTVLFNAFLQKKMGTMKMKGGNTDELYRYYDGRLKMARSLERRWPGVVKTSRRFQRPQHVVFDAWRRFDTPLKRREDIDWDSIKDTTNEYGMRLRQIDEIKSDSLREWYEKQANDSNPESE